MNSYVYQCIIDTVRRNKISRASCITIIFQEAAMGPKSLIDTRYHFNLSIGLCHSQNSFKIASVNNEITKRQFAIIAGISLLLMAVTAGFAFGFIHGILIIEGEADITNQNMLHSSSLIHEEIFICLVIKIVDLIAAWALNQFFYR